jgi:hypothetical protein
MMPLFNWNQVKLPSLSLHRSPPNIYFKLMNFPFFGLAGFSIRGLSIYMVSIFFCFQMDSQELSRKVLAHLEGSQNISFLNEYCHKNKVALPEWKPTGKPMHGNAPYLHGMQLNILGQRFEVEGAQSKNDAKKACAAAAITFFESKGLPGFVNRYHNYVALLFQLCQQIPISPPEYFFKVGASGTFIGECLVNDLRFEARLALILE